MHQYELMRLLARVMDVLADHATGVDVSYRARSLREEISAVAAEWTAEGRRFIEVTTGHG